MDKSTTKRAACCAAATALLGGCAAMYQADDWNIPPAGSTWQMSQKNTGSYGKDATFTMTRSDVEWQGQKVVKMSSVESGGGILSLPNGKWLGLVDKDNRMVTSFDPPQGYVFPLRLGQSWTTHHRSTNHVNGRSVEYDYNCHVEALEKVTVQAGTFDAFRIACENEFSQDLSWYAPRIGLHAKQEMRRKAASPAGEGTQRSELVMLKVAR